MSNGEADEDQRLGWRSAREVNTVQGSLAGDKQLIRIGGLFLFGGVLMFFDRSMYVLRIAFTGKTS